MSSGAAHAQITRTILTGGLAVLGGAALLGVLHPLHAGAGVLGLVAGHLVTPDLDVDAITHEERRALRAGCFGWAWVAWWWPYARLMAHRGLSHAPLLGTLTRAVYLLWPIAIKVW